MTHGRRWSGKPHSRGVVVLVALAVLAAAPSAARAQRLVPPFDVAYSLADLGSPPGVPAPLGGLTVEAGTTDRLLVGGAANDASGALYEVPVTRDAAGHITGFSGTATRFADAGYNDGGVTYGPGGVLVLARWPTNELGQTKPGSTITDKIIDLEPLGVASSLASLAFVPPGRPGEGRLKLASWSGGEWYDAGVAADGSGTYDLVGVTQVPDSTVPGIEGFAYVPPGSPQFAAPSLLASEYSSDVVTAYEVDAAGNPVTSTRRIVVDGLSGAEGALIDPLTGDFLFTTFGGGDHLVVVRGFAPEPGVTPAPTPTPSPSPGSAPAPRPTPSPTPSPQPSPPPPVVGTSVNVAPSGGTVRIKLPGSSRFVELTAGRQIPVGTTIDARAGRVTLTAAANRSGGTATADFYAGVFKVTQPKAAKPITQLTLVEKLSCPRARRASAAAGKKRTRRLWGDGSGRFRTRGQFSSATVRGTKWLTEDRCDRTITRVARGAVTVSDFVARRTVVVRAGRRYVAKRRR